MSEHFIHQFQAEFTVPKTMQGMAVALGNFDGAHKRHQTGHQHNFEKQLRLQRNSALP